MIWMPYRTKRLFQLYHGFQYSETQHVTAILYIRHPNGLGEPSGTLNLEAFTKTFPWFRRKL